MPAPREPVAPTTAALADAAPISIAVDIAESDPLLAYLQSAPGPVDLARLELDSPAVTALRAAGVALVVPLVSQGELIGTLNLGPRLSEQDYSTDDRRLLTTLAAQAAPAIRVAQLVREQAAEAAERERLEQEMRVATLIQQQFLPRQLPNLPRMADRRVLRSGARGRRRLLRLHRDARRADRDRRRRRHRQGRPGGARHGPDPLVLRAEASRSDSPGVILARANELLVPEMPARMFVTCLFAILEPETGRIVMANAGHNLPYIRTDDGVIELRATGMPLGLLPGIVVRGDRGRHRPGQQRPALLRRARRGPRPGPARCTASRGCARRWPSTTPAASCSTACSTRSIAFTGPDWEQEDDITLVTLRRASGVAERARRARPAPSRSSVTGLLASPARRATSASPWTASRPPSAGLGLAPGPPRTAQDGRQRDRDERHRVRQPGRPGRPGRHRRRDDGRGDRRPHHRPRPVRRRPRRAEAPDIERKLAGEQKPRGWGLFLIKNMVDSMDVTTDGTTQTVTLTMAREERSDG